MGYRLTYARRIALSYAVAVAVPIVLGLIFADHARRSAIRQVQEQNRNGIERFSDTLRSLQLEAENVAAHALLDDELERFLTLSQSYAGGAVPESERWFFLRDNSLMPYSLLSELIDSYYLFPVAIPLVLGPHISAELDTFWDYVAAIPELPADGWYRDGVRIEWEGVYRPDLRFAARTDGGETVYLPYLTTVSSVGRSPVTALFLVSQEKLAAELGRISAVEGTVAALWDGDETLIAATGPHRPTVRPAASSPEPAAGELFMHEDEELFVSVAALPSPRWTVVLHQPRSAVEEQVTLISRFSRTVVASLTAIGAILMIAVALYSSRPLFVVLQEIRTARLDPDPAIRSESDLRNAFGGLTVAANSVTRQLEAQRPVLRQLFLRNLLSGELSPEEIDKDLGLMDLTFRGRYQTVACIEFPRIEAGERALTQLAATEFLDRRFAPTVITHQIDSQRLAVVVDLVESSEAHSAQEDAHRLFERIASMLRDALDDSAAIGIGVVRSEEGELYKSLGEASVALRVALATGRHVATYGRSAVAPTSTFYFPTEQEMRLATFMKLGKAHEMTEVVDDLGRHNLGPGTAEGYRRLFVYRLVATIAGIVAEAGVGDSDGEARLRAVTMTPMPDPKSAFAEAREMAADIARSIGRSRSGEDEAYRERIAAYIEARFHESDLDLAAVADHFGVSRHHFSRT